MDENLLIYRPRRNQDLVNVIVSKARQVKRPSLVPFTDSQLSQGNEFIHSTNSSPHASPDPVQSARIGLM